MQQLRSHRRREFPCHRGEEIVAQKLADVTGEVLFEIQDFEGGQGLSRAVMLNAQRKLIERDVAVAQVILDYRAQIVDGDVVAVWKMHAEKMVMSGTLSMTSASLSSVTEIQMSGTSDENMSASSRVFNVAAIVVALLVSWCEITLPP